MKIDILTIFPGMFDGPFRESMIKRAIDQKLVEINPVDLRQYTEDCHHQVDDSPYGGGRGMIFKPEPLYKAVEDLQSDKTRGGNERVILLTPQGNTFNQEKASELAALKHLILICGHYEGVDERVRLGLVEEELSIGDFVLTGGELAAVVIVDAVVRLLPGLLSAEAAENESFTESLLEYPHYTRPAVFRGMEVPAVLLSGNHAEIERWRRQQSILRTYQRRPELLSKTELKNEDRIYLDKLKNEQSDQNNVL
ncbi:MAG: tRNA (guanine-N1)-methyltransferase [Firmicutes bacterium ML8_F2]|jgi:tRNA (guanine37-N1)-methyltransferase|nr:MAG: tRNA (guanine-N1)-methyltransferase [Firmicutes bacterium ML8_F2]